MYWTRSLDAGLSADRSLRRLCTLGVREIQFGVETLEPKTLQLLRKTCPDLARTKELFDELVSHNVVVNPSFMLGF